MSPFSLGAPRVIRVLIVDDSAAARSLLQEILQSDPGIVVVGAAEDGREAVELAEKLGPDVITMDIHMPKLNGLEATQQIMQSIPVPIVIVSGHLDSSEVSLGFQTMAAGAVAVLRRPAGPGSPTFDDESRNLIRTIKAMAEVRLVRRWSPSKDKRGSASPRSSLADASAAPDIVAIGASTGGPMALHAILSRLPADLPFPLVVVQHMSDGFMPGFIEWLARATVLPLQLIEQRTVMLPGHVYFAPDGHHVVAASSRILNLEASPPENGLRPAVGVLFRSVAEVYRERAAAILLTGMGADGAEELGRLRELGATTMAQSEETCAVFGMPGEAVRRGAARLVLPPAEIAAWLSRFSPPSDIVNPVKT